MLPVDFLHDLRFDAIPQSARHQARRCILDLVGVAASGRKTDLSRIVHGFALRQMAASDTGARLIFDGRRASASGAAYAGASTIDAFDAHDGHALTKGHAGVAVLPSILAVADAEGLLGPGGISGAELITLTVIGYEIATRAGIALHRSVSDYHTSGAWNSLACAALGARLMGLDRETTRHALGTAEYHGPRSQMMRCIDHPTMLKDGSGWGALVGVSAAYLARDGFTGAPAITIEADDQRTIWSDLGSRWRIEEQYFKPYPVCRWAQPAVEAAESLLAGASVAPAEIEKVEVETFGHGVRLGTALPASTEAAQYALGFPLAAYLVRRKIGATEVGASGLNDPEIAAMAARIRLSEDPEISARFPAKRYARVRIRTKAGRTLESELTAARGDPDSPLADAEVISKFETLAETLGAKRATAIRDAVLALGEPDRPVGPLADLVLSA